MIVTLSDIGTTTLSNSSWISISASVCGAIASAVAPRIIRGAGELSRGPATRCAGGARHTTGTRSRRAWRLGPAGQAQPMNLSDHRVAGHAIAEQTRDLARALAVDPMLLELLDYFVCPSHCRLVCQSFAKGCRITQNRTPSPGEEPAGRNADQHSL